MARLLFAFGLAALAVGCSPSTDIWVDVHTDLVPGEEVDRIVIELDDGGSRSARVDTGPAFLETARRFGPVSTSGGRRAVTVRLEHDGSTVLERTVTGSFSGPTVLTVWLTRACVGVVCPTAADPQATECDDGECVRPDCEGTGCVTPSCTLDEECTGAAPPCASHACTSGRCVLVPHDDRCGTTEYCNPDLGCVPRTVATDAGLPDAGTPTLDAGTDAGPPDAPPPPPPWRMYFLGEAASGWSMPPTSGDPPTEPIRVAFTSGSEIIALTDTELFAMRVFDRTWVHRGLRSATFPQLEGAPLFDGETIVGVNERILWIYSRDGAFSYDWDAATREATYETFTPRSSFPAAEWDQPNAPAFWQMYAVWGRPSDAFGWVSPSAADQCAPGPVGAHATYLSWDGFGPAAILASSYDYACFRFVDEAIVSDFGIFNLPGAPDPWSIEAAAWNGGLYVFTD